MLPPPLACVCSWAATAAALRGPDGIVGKDDGLLVV
jgi:hypothetical protein